MKEQIKSLDYLNAHYSENTVGFKRTLGTWKPSSHYMHMVDLTPR